MLNIRIPNCLLNWLAVSAAIFYIVVLTRIPTYFGVYLPEAVLRATSLAVALPLIYLGFDRGQSGDAQIPWWNIILLVAGLIAPLHVIFDYDGLLDYGFYGRVDAFGLAITLMLAVSLLEALRRKTGIVLPLMIIGALSVTVLQPYMPGALHGAAFSWDRLGYTLLVENSGIFGAPLGVASRIIIVFIIFAQTLHLAGAGQWFIDLSIAITGRMYGGPAKASVVASALFGSISGSPTSNVATTGAITIPLMKRSGFSANFSGAVEAVASTGGQVLPPVMGAIAFVMADWVGLPYATIAMASLVPALLVFVVLCFSIHFRARASDIRAKDIERIPGVGESFRKGWFYLAPMAILIALLIFVRLPPEMAALIALFAVIAVSYLSADSGHHIGIQNFCRALASSVRSWLMIVTVTASIGMLIGAVEMSGVGVKFSDFLLDLGRGDLVLTLLLVGVASLLLGMGLDSIALYMTLAVFMAPALVHLGVPDLAAHLYIVYWGMASFITPPICVAVFVAVSLSGGEIWKTGWEALRIGSALYIVPLSFALDPALILRGSIPEVMLAVLTALAGGVALASGIAGFWLVKSSILERGCCAIGGLLLVLPGLTGAVAGAALLLICGTLQWGRKRRMAVPQGEVAAR